MYRWTIVAVLAASVACVPKGRHDDLIASAAQTETELGAAEARIANLESALKNAEARNAELSALTDRLDARTNAQAAQLAELSDELGKLSERSSTQRRQKAALEELLAKVQAEANEARDDAAAYRERASELEEERDELAKERDALERKTAEYDALVDELQSEIASGQVTITELSGKLTVNLSNAILFDSGKTKVKDGGVQALQKVATVLAKVSGRQILVEGHTDNVPVTSGAPYPDNWALSALRASTVVALLVDNGVNPDNIAATGYGEHRPAAPNDTKENRALNRRTEIVLVPRLDDTVIEPEEADDADEGEEAASSDDEE